MKPAPHQRRYELGAALSRARAAVTSTERTSRKAAPREVVKALAMQQAAVKLLMRAVAKRRRT